MSSDKEDRLYWALHDAVDLAVEQGEADLVDILNVAARLLANMLYAHRDATGEDVTAVVMFAVLDRYFALLRDNPEDAA